MKTNIYILLIGLIFALNGCIPGKVVNGDGNIVTETISIADYHTIKAASGHITVRYIQSDEPPFLQVKTDQNIYDMYEFRTDEDGTLLIKPKHPYRNNCNFRPTEFLILTNSTALRKVEMAGSAEFNAESPLTADQLIFELAGSGRINLKEKVTVARLGVTIAGSTTLNAPDVYCDQFRGEIAGSGTMHIGGEARKANIEVAGSGKIRAFDLQIDDLKCNVAGSGNIEATVSQNIDVNAVGSGKVRYKGNPANITRNIIGSGSIRKVED